MNKTICENESNEADEFNLNKDLQLLTNSNLQVEELPRISLFINRFLFDFFWRIRDLNFNSFFIFPQLLNPSNFRTTVGRNPFGYFLFQHFMKIIPIDETPLNKVESFLYSNIEYDSVKNYKTSFVADFNIEHYKEICDWLKSYKLKIPKELTIEHELNTLYYSTNVKNVDALHYFSGKELSFPRLTIICKVFMSIFTSEACCERMFSESGHYVTKNRNRLSTINLEQFALNKINCKRINPMSKKLQKK